MIKKTLLLVAVAIVIVAGYKGYNYYNLDQPSIPIPSPDTPQQTAEYEVIQNCKEISLPDRENRIKYFTALFRHINITTTFDESIDDFVSDGDEDLGVQYLYLNKSKSTTERADSSPACWFVWIRDQNNWHGKIAYENTNGIVKVIDVGRYLATPVKYWEVKTRD